MVRERGGRPMLRASRFCVTVSIALGWVAACGGRASSESGGSAGATIASAAAGADVGGTCGSSVGCGAGRSAIGEAGSPIGEAGAGGAALAGSSGMAGAGVASSESGGGSGGAPSGSGGSGGPAIAGSGGSTAGVGTNICCNGASCVYQASTSCPEVQGLPNLYLSTFSGGFPLPTITSDCTAMQDGFVNRQPDVCSTVVFSGPASEATYCLPQASNDQQPIVKCVPDPIDNKTQLLADCPWDAPIKYSVPASGTTLCCGGGGEEESAANNTYMCVMVFNSFGTFAYGAMVDSDQDTRPDLLDNCSRVYNFLQEDQDHDFVGDVCDNCPGVANQNQKNTTSAAVGDACNCALPGVKVGPSGTRCP